MKEHGLSLGLSPFFRHEPLPTLSPTPAGYSHNPFECSFQGLTIMDHNTRTSGTSSRCDVSTPPISPADPYMSLYPLPPHLTPRTSPMASRSTSPTWGEEDHDGDSASTYLLGKLTVTVVEARGLAVSSAQEKPYVLLQYDRTDSVSREYGAVPLPAPLTEAKRGIKRLTGLGRGPRGRLGNEGPVTVRRVGSGGLEVQPLVCNESKRIVTGEIPTGDIKDIGTPDAPIWNHVAQFDVVQPGRTILLCAYDKLAPQGGFPAHGFLGAAVLEPVLSPDLGVDGQGLDIWLPLTSALDPTVGGEVRLRIFFESLNTRPKLCVDDFSVLRQIGQGNFGVVYRVRKRDTKRIYAMKVISKKRAKSSSDLAQVLAERQVLARTLDSPFLVGLKFSFQSAANLFFVIDYKSGGELFAHLQRDGGRFEESKVRFYVAEIILALGYLHANGILYRDLKPENCLLDGSGHVVLVDFGLSKLLSSSDSTTNTLCGTTAFMAPEVLMDVGYNYRCDWWSLGVLLFEMCYGFCPFYAESRVEEYERILSGDIKVPIKAGYSDAVRDLLLKLLTRDPDERIGAHGGATEIQAHPFFNTVDWQKYALRQVSPPFKPPVSADEDACDYNDRGRSFDWMFRDGQCWQSTDHVEALGDLDSEGLFRDFSFTGVGGRPEVGAWGGRRSSYDGTPP